MGEEVKDFDDAYVNAMVELASFGSTIINTQALAQSMLQTKATVAANIFNFPGGVTFSEIQAEQEREVDPNTDGLADAWKALKP